MKNKLFASVGLSLLALNVFGSAAYATENTEELQSEVTQEKVNSDVGIRFLSGGLRIREASDLSFLEVEIPRGTMGVPVVSGRTYVDVADQRGTRQGWSLGAALSPIVGDNGNELRGAYLEFSNLGIDTDETDDKENPAVVPEKKRVLQQGGDFQTFMAARKGSGAMDTRLILSDERNNWKSKLEDGTIPNNDILLVVKGSNAEPQSYKAQLYWMLTNAPV